MMNWKGFQKKWPWHNWGHNYPGICLAGLRKIMKLLSQGSQCSGYALNWTSPKYKSIALTLCQLTWCVGDEVLTDYTCFPQMLLTLWIASSWCKGIAKSSPLYLVFGLHSESFHVIFSLACSEYLCPKCLACHTFLRYFLCGSNSSLFLFQYSGFHLSCHSILDIHTFYLTSKYENFF
jgi:hypothetical protein